MIRNTNEILSIAAAVRFPGIPTRLWEPTGPSTFDVLLAEEKIGITEAAKTTYQTYQTVLESLE